jgi:hypothetical protein
MQRKGRQRIVLQWGVSVKVLIVAIERKVRDRMVSGFTNQWDITYVRL